jgi:hypothetical protein
MKAVSTLQLDEMRCNYILDVLYNSHFFSSEEAAAQKRPPSTRFSAFPVTWQADCECCCHLAKLAGSSALTDGVQQLVWIHYRHP